MSGGIGHSELSSIGTSNIIIGSDEVITPDNFLVPKSKKEQLLENPKTKVVAKDTIDPIDVEV